MDLVYKSVYKFFNKEFSGDAIKSEIMSNQQLPKELHKFFLPKSLKNVKDTHLLKTIFGLLILQICN